MLLDWGNVGYQIGAAGIVAFAVAFLFIVRWWTDHLGRMIAGVLAAMSGVLIVTTLRMINPELAENMGFLLTRLLMFWAFGLGVWTALGSLIWAQFLAPRISGGERMTTRKEYRSEEAYLADSRHGSDGSLDGLPGGDAG